MAELGQRPHAKETAFKAKLYSRRRFALTVAYLKKFGNRLEDLWKLRQAELVNLTDRVGRRRIYYKDRERRIDRIVEAAEESMVRKDWVRRRFRGIAGSADRVLVSRSIEQKQSKVWDTLAEYQDGPVVYSYWEGQRCRYVGRSDAGIGRMWAPDERRYWKRTTRVEAMEPTTSRRIDELECMAIHFLRPLHNRYRASQRAYRSRCPVCEALDALNSELRELFSLRA